MGMHVCIWVHVCAHPSRNFPGGAACLPSHEEAVPSQSTGQEEPLTVPLSQNQNQKFSWTSTSFSPVAWHSLHGAVREGCNLKGGRMSASPSSNIILSIQSESSFWYQSHQKFSKDLQGLAPSSISFTVDWNRVTPLCVGQSVLCSWTMIQSYKFELFSWKTWSQVCSAIYSDYNRRVFGEYQLEHLLQLIQQ